jgi:hypothetical protein
MQNHECHTRYTDSSPQPAPAASVKIGVTLLACHLAENSVLCLVCPTAYDFDSPFERHKANMHSVIAVFCSAVFISRINWLHALRSITQELHNAFMYHDSIITSGIITSLWCMCRANVGCSSTRLHADTAFFIAGKFTP